jgi:protein involved in temperature-dependent protein secretion
MDDRYPHHGDWHHGCWNGHWGEGWWGHMWSEHPVAAAYGLSWWGVNRAAYWSGYWPYYNPYAYELPMTVYNYSTPFVEYVPVQTTETMPAPATGGGTPAAGAAEILPPGVTSEGMKAFDAARDAFKQGNYDLALAQVNQAVKQMPNDALIHEFRALVMFALGNYKEAAATLYPVLSVGPGWDWTTMISLYSSPAEYEKQLRALEKYVTNNPKSGEGRFVLAYQYITCGHNTQAAEQLKEVRAIYPEDRLAANLLAMVSPNKSAASQAPAAGTSPKPALDPTKTIKAAQLTGTWTASGAKGANFTMNLTADGKFTWTYSQGSKREEVKGVFAIEQNTLALEPNGAGDSGAMLADITLKEAGKMKFSLIGAPKDDPGLEFVLNKS